MCYFKQDGAMHGSWLSGQYVPSAPITRVICDKCAEVEVEFETSEVGGHHRFQKRPWKWAPWYGGDQSCDRCGKPKI